jgi:hypothetical protein
MAYAGFGRGRGLGRGFRHGSGGQVGADVGSGISRGRRAYSQAYPEDALPELDRLKNQARRMQRSLDAVNQKISELEKSE